MKNIVCKYFLNYDCFPYFSSNFFYFHEISKEENNSFSS